MSTALQQQAIVRAAREAGTDPAFALAVADRESSFNPQARSSKSIRGMYQMRGDLRGKYGVGDSDDPYEQAQGWQRFMPDVRKEMGSRLGRDPTDPESYLGHHFGATRAARMLKMDPSTPVDAIFTPQEMGLNPHFARAGTVGNLNSTVMGDVEKRMARFGGGTDATEPADLSSFGDASSIPQASPKKIDLSSFGDPAAETAGGADGAAGSGSPAAPTPQPSTAPRPLDLSSFGTPVA